MSHDTPAASAEGSARVDNVTVRLVMPDRWLEHVEQLPLSTTLGEAKELGLRTLLQRSTDNPSDYYVEYAERRIRDEGLSLADLGFQPREIVSIRAYDLGHYKRFEG
jgi:hypothetical protein